METEKNNRGFKYGPKIVCSYGTVIGVSESSAASSSPHIWLRLTQDNKILTRPELGMAAAHLTLNQAKELRDQLDWFIRNHYQLK